MGLNWSMEYTKLNHALHNEDVCNYLNQEKTFNDWVVTTAFYSARYFIEDKLFPLKYNDKEYNNFETFYADIYKYKINSINRHSALKVLIERHCPKIASTYRNLFDSCQNARYSDYRIPQHMKNHALNKLKVIKGFCIKEN